MRSARAAAGVRTFIALAQVDDAPRDLLETMSHGPRGDVVSVYATFPWPALCAEIAKLQIKLRSTARTSL